MNISTIPRIIQLKEYLQLIIRGKENQQRKTDTEVESGILLFSQAHRSQML